MRYGLKAGRPDGRFGVGVQLVPKEAGTIRNQKPKIIRAACFGTSEEINVKLECVQIQRATYLNIKPGNIVVRGYIFRWPTLHNFHRRFVQSWVIHCFFTFQYSIQYVYKLVDV